MAKYTNYTKYFEDWSELSIEDLLEKLSDQLLHSGFEDSYSRFNPMNEDLRMQDLYDMLMDEMSQWDTTQSMTEEQLQQLIAYILQRMEEEGYIRQDGSEWSDELGEIVPAKESSEQAPMEARIELTDKSIDFLG